MITILHIIGNLKVHGAQSVVMNYLRSLNNDSDIKLIIAVLGEPTGSPYEKECEKSGYELHFLHYKRKGVPLIHSFLNWVERQRLYYREIKRVKPNIVHTHITSIFQTTVFPILLSGVKIKVHTLHSDPFYFSKMEVLWARFAFHVAGFYPICVTEEQAKKAEKRYGLKNYTIIKNGIDISRFGNVDKIAIRKELGISKDTFVIGCVGRFSKVKNHKFLVRIFAKYVKDHPNSLLLLVGEGEEQKRLESYIKDLCIQEKVIFAGVRSDVERIYYAMDLFMLTSHFESSSIVTVEAQLAGTRCVISSSIPSNVVITPLVNRIALNEPDSVWLDAMGGKLPPDKTVGCPEDFYASSSAKKLKDLYLRLL